MDSHVKQQKAVVDMKGSDGVDDVLFRRYNHAIKTLQAIAQRSGRDKSGCWNEWTEARAFRDCKTAAFKCLKYLDEPTSPCDSDR